MKRIFFLPIALTVLAVGVASYASGSGEIRWVPLKEGMERAKIEKKPMIVDFFFGKGCPRCEALQKGVYDDPVIAKKIMDDFVPIRVDLTRKLTPDEERLGNLYNFKNDCLLLFLDHNGEIIKDPSRKRLCFVDTVGPEWFVKYLDMIRQQQK
ncbi:MAG: thioredoxin family protein [Nitrospirae bacterium]|nr:thioredoxin family protein [Nitrospirota bacterium]